MISNRYFREDTSALIMFLKTIKDRCGNIALHWFMSDDADNILMLGKVRGKDT